MENPASAEIYRNFVERIFVIEDVTMGSQKDGFLTRYRGHLRVDDSEQAYFQLAEQLKPFNITPLFRKEKDKQVVLLVEGVANPKESNPWVNLVLFILTLMSVLLTGAMYGMKDPFSGDIFHIVISIFQNGWPFGVSMLAILGTHEFGHYLMGRHHGVHVTLPYFIPLPFSPFGTMGAFINMKEPPKNRRQLLDIGLAGPLAGLIVAIPVLFIGLKLSTIDLLPFASVPGQMLQLEGNSLLYLFMKFLAFGKLLPSPTSFNGLNPVLYWIGYFFTG
ncbi:MAG TPA: site-2 protease family protein, partial [Leptolinea sp.]